jgi:allantoinase
VAGRWPTASISFAASDHAPGRWPEEKEHRLDLDRLRRGGGGRALLPYLYSEGVVAGRLTLERLVELTSARPARLFGIDHRKGGLWEGLDADFAVLDPEARWTVRASELHSLNRSTPFDGLELTGRVRATYVRGRLRSSSAMPREASCMPRPATADGSCGAPRDRRHAQTRGPRDPPRPRAP